MKEIKVINNEYYHAESLIKRRENGLWHGRAVIYRKDNDEKVGALNVDNKDRDYVVKRLEERILAYLKKHGCPIDFGERDQVESILNAYKLYKQKVTDIRLYAEGCRMQGGLTQEILQNCFRDILLETRKSLQSIFHRVADLTEEEKIRLVQSPEAYYASLVEDAKYIDDIQARIEMFDFIFDPSEAIKTAHQRHLKRVNSMCTEQSSGEGEVK